MFSGDEREFARIVRAHQGLVSKILRKHPVTRAQHDDLMQEIFLSLYIQLLQREIENIPAYLCKIAARKAAKVIIASSRVSLVQVNPEVHTDANHDTHEHFCHDLELRRLLKGLSSVERGIVEQFHKGRSHKEIAKTLRITEANSRKILSNLRQRLRLRFPDYRMRKTALSKRVVPTNVIGMSPDQEPVGDEHPRASDDDPPSIEGTSTDDEDTDG